MIPKISFANLVHQLAILVRVIKTHALNVWVAKIEYYKDNHVVACLLTLNLVVKRVANATLCVKNAK